VSKKLDMADNHVEKEPKHSAKATEIKKEYLKEHLNEVNNLVATWMGELTTPSLIVRERGQVSWGWSIIYRPPSEHNPDSNNIIRRYFEKSNTMEPSRKLRAQAEKHLVSGKPGL